MTCPPGYDGIEFGQFIDSRWAVRCCINAGCSPSNPADYEPMCWEFLSINVTESVCNCGALCNGQVNYNFSGFPLDYAYCTGECLCTGDCCSVGAACNSTPTSAPTTKAPTKAPTTAPTSAPTTKAPTKAPTNAPTNAPTEAPTNAPTTESPTEAPSEAATEAPSEAPTSEPTTAPTEQGDNGMALAMSLIFVPIGVIILVGGIYFLYQGSVKPSVKQSRTLSNYRI